MLVLPAAYGRRPGAPFVCLHVHVLCVYVNTQVLEKFLDDDEDMHDLNLTANHTDMEHRHSIAHMSDRHLSHHFHPHRHPSLQPTHTQGHAQGQNGEAGGPPSLEELPGGAQGGSEGVARLLVCLRLHGVLYACVRIELLMCLCEDERQGFYTLGTTRVYARLGFQTRTI